jgi:putative hemolysin
MNEHNNIVAEEEHPVFSFADAEMGAISNKIIRSLERVTGQPKISQLYFDYVSENLNPSNFWSDALDRLGIAINLQREQYAHIPKTGRVVAVSNHPYGVIDGLVLCALMAEVREDYKIITHRVLRQAPAVMDKILPIDFDETEAALANNLKVRSDAMAHLKNDGAIIIFPAGSISLAPRLFGSVYDLEWKTFAAKLAEQKNTTTVPFYFDGRNSILFQMARSFSQTLGYSLMFREICKKMGTSVNITMRNPVSSETLKALSNRMLAADYMRRKTYGML